MKTFAPTGFALPILIAALIIASCRATSAPADMSPQAFLDRYTKEYQELYYASSEAEWASNTKIIEGDETNALRTRSANEDLAEFTGSVENIEAARAFLAAPKALTELQKLQLEQVLFAAAGSPQTIPDLVVERIAAETAQTEKLYGFSYKLDGKEVTPNQIDAMLSDELDVAKRRAVWESSKEVGPGLRPGLIELQRLRNSCVQALGYSDFFAYMVSEYGMTTEEMAEQMETINRELRPLFTELHTWARYKLAERYNQPVPDLIPAHWLPNRWGQDWAALVDVEGLDLDSALEQRGSNWLLEQAERFYVSLGFEELPDVFWEKSSLYPLPAGANYKKNNHASAWHMDLERDVRSLMSVEPDTRWYETTHHELGHIYYYLEYTNPNVPPLLRGGANRAYHEAVGSLMGLAAMQPRFLTEVGLIEAGSFERSDELAMQQLLNEALNYVVFIPWSTGVMFQFEKALYADELSPDQWNAYWWEIAERYQGIAPPDVRDERYCDAATKTHINNDPAGYYDYALSYVLLFQLHNHIATQILGEDPHDTNYFNREDVGEFLSSILKPGASVDWRELLLESTGSPLSAQAMLDYFAPLQEWLEKENAGRKATLAPL